MYTDLKTPFLPINYTEDEEDQQDRQHHQRRNQNFTVDKEGFRTPRWLGYFYQLGYIFQICLQEMFAKVLFQRHTSMNPMQLLFLRMILSSFIYLGLMGRDAKYYLKTSLTRETMVSSQCGWYQVYSSLSACTPLYNISHWFTSHFLRTLHPFLPRCFPTYIFKKVFRRLTHQFYCYPSVGSQNINNRCKTEQQYLRGSNHGTQFTTAWTNTTYNHHDNATIYQYLHSAHTPTDKKPK
ncbi:hypothetical protein FGO68_gene15449 [Halteria grandinella]|uniref:Uncharacterized protein n=1 Tax=Halteria grandinella TaxID=5974 RepID=A0A8J8NL32_HALGN|nr:hypothetical protein FGO68_gene15449 [Halteria grandinella]